MVQNHLIAGNPSEPKGFRAYWATRPKGTAIVFVHGFNGEAVGTWSLFERFLPQDPRCAGCDLVFFQYDSVYTNCAISASELHTLLTRLSTDRATLVDETLGSSGRPPRPVKYKRVLLIAHSMGAVVARKALLRMYRNRNKDLWAKTIILLLFAPAHLGAHVTHLVSLLGIIPYVGQMLPFVRYKIPALTELGINERGQMSRSLEDMRTDTKEALERGAFYLRARKVIFGTADKVVVPGEYCDDENFDSVAGREHKDICKPTTDYLDPLNVVMGFL